MKPHSLVYEYHPSEKRDTLKVESVTPKRRKYTKSTRSNIATHRNINSKININLLKPSGFFTYHQV